MPDDMTTLFDSRRYLTDFESARAGNILTDVLVIGSGVAGIRAALEAARSGHVTRITTGDFSQSATYSAQGGIALAHAADDLSKQHSEDTLFTACVK